MKDASKFCQTMIALAIHFWFNQRFRTINFRCNVVFFALIVFCLILFLDRVCVEANLSA